MEIQRRCKSYYWKRVQVLHGGKKSGRKLSLNRVWDRTAALTGVSRYTAQKIVEEKKKAHDEQRQPKQPPSSTVKVSLGDFDQGVVRRTIAKMYCLKKVLPTHDNIRWEQSSNRALVTLTARVVFEKISAYTRCRVNRKVLMERQYVVLSRIRYLPMVRELRKAGYTVVYTWWWLRDRQSKRERGWNLKNPSTVMKLLNKYK